jgi:chromosome segregation ATPase
MLVLKKKYDKLVHDYNFLVDIKNDWKDSYNQSQSKVGRLEQQCNRLYKELDKADDAVVELNFKCETEEKYKDMWFQRFIKTKEELDIVDRIVLQYEQRINELEEKLNETTI